MSNPEQKTVRYGLYYKAIFQLVESAPDKIILIFLTDEYRQQMRASLMEQTIFISQKRISEILGLNRRTVTASLSKLEQLGLIKVRPNAITFHGDEFVSLIKHYESLGYSEQVAFASEFKSKGIEILNGKIQEGSRKDLTGLQGTSFLSNHALKYAEVCKNTQTESSNGASCAEIHNDVQKCTTMCKNTHLGAKMHRFLHQFAEIVQKCTKESTFDMVFSTTPCAEMHNNEYEAMKEAFYTGNFSENIEIDQNLLCTLAQLAVLFYTRGCAEMHNEDPKSCAFLHNSNYIYNNKNNKPASLSEKGEEGFPLKPLSNEEGFQPSFTSEAVEDSLGIIELEGDVPFGKRSSRTIQVKNKKKLSSPYKDKPFFAESDAKKITASLDPAVTYTSPVKLFINLFWWGCWDLYTENYDARDYDEHGDPIDSEDINDLKMIDAVLPVEDLLKLAEQVYDDIAGAVEKGEYEDSYGTYKLGFDSIDDLQPHFIFDWEEAEANGRKGLKVSLKRFRNIEATVIEKVPSPRTRSEIIAESKLDRAFTKSLMQVAEENLTPVEKIIRKFYETFVTFSDDYRPENYTNSEKQSIEGHSLPGYIYKGTVAFWCNEQELPVDELYETLSQSERHVHGADLKMTRNIFSVRNVYRWNVSHGYEQSVAGEIINQNQ